MGGIGYLETVDTEADLIESLNNLQSRLSNFSGLQEEAEKDLYRLKISNAQALLDMQTKLINKEAEEKLDTELKVNKKMLELGISRNKDELKFRKKTIHEKIEAEKKEALALAEKKAGKKGLSPEKKQAIEAEFKEREKKEKDLLDRNFKNRKEIEKKLTEQENKKKAKEKEKEAKAAGEQAVKEFSEGVFSKGKTLAERGEAFTEAFTNDTGEVDLKKGLVTMTKALSDLAKQLDQSIDSIASSKTAIDTRLQGSKNKTRFGSYWDRMSNDIVGVAGVSPFVKQSDIVDKIKEMVKSGIAFNVEQRAFLATISDKIATTFEAADGTLLRLIRLQQQDSTAARLGMESTLTAFLNNMYENTEYLNSIASTVRSSLEEAESLMGTKEALEFEFQAQKWLGSMFSVGVSQSAITKLSDAIGKLSSGDISGLTSDGVGNLLIMAANNANLPLTDILAKGLDASSTNKLLKAMVNYLSGIYAASQDSKVIQQQFANVYGLTASDLKAITNLTESLADQESSTIKAISENNLTYNMAISQLTSMANTMYQRTSIGEMMTNVWDNFKYTMSAGIANSPILYATYKIANLLDDVVGGINIPAISVFGSGVNLNASVADLMRVAALSGSALKGIGQMIAAQSGGGISGSGMLKAMGVDLSDSAKVTAVSRGTGQGLKTSGVTTSESGFIGNSSGGDVYNKTMSDATDSSKGQLASAKEEEEQDTPNKTIDEHIVQIYSLLQTVIYGGALKVDMANVDTWTAAFRSATNPY